VSYESDPKRPNRANGKCKAWTYGFLARSESSCRRKATRDGFCVQHHPDAKAARDAKWEAKFEAGQDLSDARHKVANAERAVIRAAKTWEINSASATFSLSGAVRKLLAAEKARDEAQAKLDKITGGKS
jgi:hypothetical protein